MFLMYRHWLLREKPAYSASGSFTGVVEARTSARDRGRVECPFGEDEVSALQAGMPRRSHLDQLRIILKSCVRAGL